MTSISNSKANLVIVPRLVYIHNGITHWLRRDCYYNLVKGDSRKAYFIFKAASGYIYRLFEAQSRYSNYERILVIDRFRAFFGNSRLMTQMSLLAPDLKT